jgi:hypothetical protein
VNVCFPVAWALSAATVGANGARANMQSLHRRDAAPCSTSDRDAHYVCQSGQHAVRGAPRGRSQRLVGGGMGVGTCTVTTNELVVG